MKRRATGRWIQSLDPRDIFSAQNRHDVCEVASLGGRKDSFVLGNGRVGPTSRACANAAFGLVAADQLLEASVAFGTSEISRRPVPLR